jgi:alkaline phosphatase
VARANAEWYCSGMDEGDHTDTKVQVFANGRGSELLGGENVDNTHIGMLLLWALRGY